MSEYDQWSPRQDRQVPEQAQTREVVLVDRNGRPLVVKEPRPVGFRVRPSKP